MNIATRSPAVFVGLIPAITILATPVAPAVADELYVPGDYATIGSAIAAAQPGDHVVIANGVYTGHGNRNLSFGGKAITVRSASGDPSQCIIDCEGTVDDPQRGFNFVSGETADAVLSGMTIMNGFGPANDDPQHGDDWYSCGGAIFCAHSSPTIANCRLIGNEAAWGGALFTYRSNLIVRDCLMVGNVSERWGGAVELHEHSPLIVNCRFFENEAGQDAGGVYCYRSDPTLANCIFSGNWAGDRGGAMYLTSSDPTLKNCTLYGNAAGHCGGVSGYVSRPRFANCILWNQTTPEIYMAGQSAVATYCAIRNGAGESWFDEGCIDVDPMLIDADGPDDDPATWEDNDFRLGAGSPCVDAGDNLAVAVDVGDFDGDGDMEEPLPVDIFGLARFIDDPDIDDSGNPGHDLPVVDMGACEYRPAGLLGDMDCDGSVTAMDINPFVRALGGEASYLEYWPGCDWLNGDLNEDGRVDFADINPFIEAMNVE